MTIKAQVIDLEGSRARLEDAMEEIQYPFKSLHYSILHLAIVFECVDERGHIAGWLWFYSTENEEHVWTIHAIVLPNYRLRFFSRSLVNTVSGVLYALGCEIVRGENENQELLYHFGATKTENGVDLQLPFFWS